MYKKKGDKFHTENKSRLQEINLVQRTKVDYKGKIPTKYWVQGFNKRVFRKERLIQKVTAGDIVQWNMINKRHSPQEEYPTRPAKVDLRRKAVPDPPSQ
jgi:hypothetical protein